MIGADGQIVSADAPILHLQQVAGGRDDGPLLVPQLAALARLALQLKILIARPVRAGGEGSDIRMWARARPHDDGVELTIHDWRETHVASQHYDSAQRAADIALAAEGWSWQTDQNMHFVRFENAAPGALRKGDEALPPGQAFTAIFNLDPDQSGGNAILASIAQRRSFFDEFASSVERQSRVFRLSGHPLFDVAGNFAGYRGKAALVENEVEGAPRATVTPSPESAESFLPDFGKRLDLALRQPLGRIIANADTISRQTEGPLRLDYATYATDIALAGRHLMELVDDLADLQAIDRPNFQVAREEIDLADIARRAAGLLGVRAADKHIQIEAPRADESLPAVGEFRRALQIMVNLVGNAVRYSPENAQVWLRVDVVGDMAALVVADQGYGIAPEDQERMFEKFERLGRDDSAGSGLGLYISRRLARAMGGDIRVDSAPGQGARFVLTLPHKPSSAA
ncbi:MAG: HAMP domain-containing sensor histidine kinase [Sphingobium sp.]